MASNFLDVGLRLSLNRAGLTEAKTGLQSISKQLAQLKTQVVGFAGAAFSFQGISALGKIADEYKNLNARLKNASVNAREYAAAQQEVYALAQRNQTALGEIAASYTRVDAAVRAFGGSQKLAFETTERLVQASKVYATSNEASKEVLAQLTAAFADGIVKTNEFSQIIKNAPGLLEALANGLGISQAELRKLAADGKLTAEVLTRALGGAADVISKKAAEIPNTIGDALVVMRNSFVKAFGELDAKLGGSSTAVEALNAVAANMKRILDGAVTAVKILAGLLVRNLVVALSASTVALIQNAIAARAAASAATEMGIATWRMITPLQALAGVLNVLLAAFVGWEFGTWLRENFKVARDAGYYFVQSMLVLWERLKQAFRSIGPVLVLAWSGTMDKLYEIAATFYDRVATIFDKLPGKFAATMAQSMRDAAGRLRAEVGKGAGDVAGEELDKITAEAETNIAAIKDAFGDLRESPLEPSTAAPSPDGRKRTGGIAGGAEGPSDKEMAKRLKEELDRAQVELETALHRRQITEQQYYDARSDLIRIAYDKDIVAQNQAMDELNKKMAESFEGRADSIAQRLARREERITRDQGLGRIGAVDAKEKVGDERNKARAEIDALIKAAEPLEGVLGTETLERLRDIRDEIGEMKTPLQEMGESLKANLKDPLADAFEAIINGSKSAKAAIADFGNAMVAMIQRIAAERLATMFFEAFLPTPAKRADGGPIKRAAGGYVSGPGGPKEDRVPALLSNGEFVISAAAVRKWGTSFFDALNGGVLPAPARAPAYAMGGLVRRSGGSGGAGGGTLVQVINNGAPVKVDSQESSIAPDGRAIERIVVSAIERDAAVGGPAIRAIQRVTGTRRQGRQS